MSSQSFTIKKFHFIAIAILVVGGGLRLGNLGGPHLTNREADHALNAAHETGQASPFNEETDRETNAPLYELITQTVFEIGGASNSTARLVSALAGIGLFLTPLLFRKKLGTGISLMMAGMIAVSPLFVTTSRSALGASLASMGLYLVLLIVFTGEEKVEDGIVYLGAFSIAITLAVGRSGLSGLLILTFALLIGLRTGTHEIPAKLKQISLWLVPATLLLVVTRLGSSLGGISTYFDSIFAYIQSWSMASEYSVGNVLMLMPVYAPAMFLFGSIGAIQSLRERTANESTLLVFLTMSIVYIVIYPGRMPEDILWPAFVMVFFASKSISKLASEFWIHGFHPVSIAIAVVFGVLYSIVHASKDTHQWNVE